MRNPVWVIDDNAAVSESVAALLMVSQIDAKGMTSGREALNRLQRGEEPSVMILDITMPINGGNKVLEEIKDNPQWTFPVIVLTGWEESVHKDVIGRVFKILPKTVAPTEMIATVRRALGDTT